MRPLERRPGNAPGLPGCACPGVSLALCAYGWAGLPRYAHRLPASECWRFRGGRNRTALLEARETPSAPPVKCPKDRHILAPDSAPPGRTTDPEAMNFVPRRFERGLGRR